MNVNLSETVEIKGLGPVQISVGEGDLVSVGVSEFGYDIAVPYLHVTAVVQTPRAKLPCATYEHHHRFMPSARFDEDGFPYPVEADAEAAHRLFHRIVAAAKAGRWNGPVDNPHWERAALTYVERGMLGMEG